MRMIINKSYIGHSKQKAYNLYKILLQNYKEKLIKKKHYKVIKVFIGKVDWLIHSIEFLLWDKSKGSKTDILDSYIKVQFKK